MTGSRLDAQQQQLAAEATFCVCRREPATWQQGWAHGFLIYGQRREGCMLCSLKELGSTCGHLVATLECDDFVCCLFVLFVR